MHAVRVHKVHKSFLERDGFVGAGGRRVEAVAGVSFSVAPGETFGILGPNGSGKSTLIRLIATLLLPDRGEVEVFGCNVVSDRLKVRRLINRVSVEAAFFKKLSAWENLLFAGRLYGLARGEVRSRGLEIARHLGLSPSRLSGPLENLSRGQQQKVAVIRAFMTRPRVLLLDEPTTGLDPRSRRDVQRFVLEMQRRYGTTVLLTSHDMDEIEILCSRAGVLHRGRLVAMDTPRRLIEAHGGGKSLEEVFFHLTGADWEEEMEAAE